MAWQAVLMAAGFALNAYGKHKSAKAQSNALKSEAGIAKFNAMAAKLKAQADADLQVIQSRHVLAGMKADYAGAGVEGGSVDAVMMDSAINAEMDRLSILFGGDVRSKAFMAESQAKISASRDVKKAGLLDTLSSGFMAASSFSGDKG